MFRRPFIWISLLMLGLFMAGLLYLRSNLTPPLMGDYWTGTAVVLTNASVSQTIDAERTAAAIIPTLTFTPSPTATATPLSSTPTATPSPTGTASPTPTASSTVSYPTCAWAWARQDAPEVTPLAQAALDAAGIDAVVQVEFYGENCLQGNSVAYFAAMTTDFYLTLETDLADRQALAALVEQAYAALLTLPDDPNRARLGYLDMVFNQGSASLRFRAMFDEIERYRDDGLSGVALVEAAGGWR